MCSSIAQGFNELLPSPSPSLSRRRLYFHKANSPPLRCSLGFTCVLKHFMRTVMWDVKWISRKEKNPGVPWGHLEIKGKDGTIILTAGGTSKLLIKRLTIKNMKSQVSRGLLILFWCFGKIWLYGTIFTSHCVALKNGRENTSTTWSSLRGQEWKPRCAQCPLYITQHCAPCGQSPLVVRNGWWIRHAYARPAKKSGAWPP